MNQNANKPPIGGAELEAMFAYPSVGLADSATIAKSLKESGCTPRRHKDWIARASDFDFIKPSQEVDVEQFFSWAMQEQVEDANVCYEVRLYDQDVGITLSIDFSQSVVSLSTTEDFLWGFSNSIADADYRRLEAYYDLCEAVCNACPPERGIIGSESCHADEISLSKDTDKFAYNKRVFFSEVSKRSLFGWYVNVYGHRWDETQHLD